MKIEELNEKIAGSQKHGKVDLQKLSEVKYKKIHIHAHPHSHLHSYYY